MTDNRYSSHSQPTRSQYTDNYCNQAYAGSNTGSSLPHSPRHPASFGHPNVARRDSYGQPSQPPSYSNAYPMPQRAVTPSLAGNPQGGYSQGSSRQRSSSISIHSSSTGPFANNQLPPIHSNPHNRSSSQAHPIPAQTAHYPPVHPHMHPAAYAQRSSTPAPSSAAGQYYGLPSSMMEQVPASPQRPFPCDMCALSFNRQHDLKRHKETHTGERPYLCNGGCGKTFTRKDALKRHQVRIMQLNNAIMIADIFRQLVKNCGRVED